MIFKQRFFTFLLGLLFATVLNDQASALYDPGVGRFCSRDPIGYTEHSMELYSAIFTTKSAVDPFGNDWRWPWEPDADWWFGIDNPFRPNPLPSRPSAPPSPLTPPPGTGPRAMPAGYGYYCGFHRAANCTRLPGGGWEIAPGQPRPLDELDRACMAHDCCLADAKAVLGECLSAKCNPEFCAALKAMSCALSHRDPQQLYECQVMKRKALLFFCDGPLPPLQSL